MIQFNLLPDIKLDYIKARRTKRSVVLISVVTAGVALGIFVMLFITVNVLQKQHMKNLTADINKLSNELKEVDELDRILTVQNQLNKLPELHQNKAVLSRMKGFISQVTPAQVSYSEIELDVSQATMRFTGSADSLKTINQFVDTLKFTKYSTSDKPLESSNAFSNVVLTSFDTNKEAGFTFELNLSYDPTIYSTAADAALSVPSIITTRSSIARPTENILQAVPPNQPGGAQ